MDIMSPNNNNEASEILKEVNSSQSKNKIKKPLFLNILTKYLAFIFLTFLLSLLGYSYFKFMGEKKVEENVSGTKSGEKVSIAFKKFSSENDFKEYLQNSQSISSYNGLMGSMPAVGRSEEAVSLKMAAPNAVALDSAGGSFSQASRVSSTNVREIGIDEPDIVKTDGKNIFYSEEQYMLFEKMVPTSLRTTTDVAGSSPVQQNAAALKIIQSFPINTIKELEPIAANGNLLISGKNLIVISNNNFKAYDISDVTKPKQTWNYTLESGSYLTATRLFNNKLYLTVSQYINSNSPCPVRLMTPTNGAMISIACTDIYYPGIETTTDQTYTVMELDPTNGNILNKISFTGSNGNTVVYMSQQAIYIAYSHETNLYRFMSDFLTGEGTKFLTEDMIKKIKDLDNLEISDAAKSTELSVIINKYTQSLDASDRLKYDNDYANYFKAYLETHKRELTTTGIAKIKASDLSFTATGEVPGTVLNDFSMDEYQGNLRIATTTSNNYVGSSENVNDVYILDKNMQTLGSVLDLGKGERIYSARFIGDRGYVVTFKQVDPFYVLDLTDPKNPQMKGELKIPGYSSYLHPISEHIVLGVGMESSKVKLSLFNVTDPANPTEVSKYSLNEYWSEASNNHHAFLLDPDHKIFFMPGGQGGYVISYNNNELVLEKAVPEMTAKRAVYLNDYLYILGSSKMVVYNENNWERIKELSF
jgi:uncharacterized secreted protein with C-terminal beta-propeller domain